ncbi:MAG: DUF494 domain-containing protein [Gemmatimonadaceae bacterium]|jgi:Smg protein|nr:DUF494 domain-containing protein [Gemmatimonadaceae bacterium]
MSFRVLGPHERGRFAPEAWGCLIGMAATGTLGPTELELVIERALAQFDGRISLDDIRALLDGSAPDDLGSGPEPVTVH